MVDANTKDVSALEDTDKTNAAAAAAASGEDQNAARQNIDGEENKNEDDGEDAEVTFESNWTQQVESFDDMGLKEDLLRGIYGFGFQEPSKIQEKGVLPVIQGRDTIAQAQSGTGKTGCFSIAVLQMIDTASDNCQALIVAPTRELSHQIAFVVKSLGEHMGVKVHACVGGTVVKDDIKILKAGPHVVVGTPGRIHDMMRRKYLRTEYLRIFTLDEADELLDRGFKPQIQDIFKFLPGDIQISLFSATMPPDILKLTKHFMRDPAKILVKSEELTLVGIKQYYIAVKQESWKIDVLLSLYSNLDINQALIYCNTKKRVEELEKSMTEKDFVVSVMHGEMEQ